MTELRPYLAYQGTALKGYAQPRIARPVMRRYSIAAFLPSGEIVDIDRIAPAFKAFEHACAAFARGTLISTEHGPVAIEDLMPGTRVKTAHGKAACVLWRGSISHTPKDSVAEPLVRVSSDTFGPSRPLPDLLLGPGARIFRRAVSQTGRQRGELVDRILDGETLIPVRPVSAVQLFHIAFDTPYIVYANGLECEACDPSSIDISMLSREQRRGFWSLFPHIAGAAQIAL